MKMKKNQTKRWLDKIFYVIYFVNGIFKESEQCTKKAYEYQANYISSLAISL